MGGNTVLEYENHEARNYSGLIGGSRIKKITQVDSVSNIQTVKTYSYTQANSTNSSGFLCLKPVYKFDSRNADVAGEFWNSALYSLLLSESGKPAVGYSRVKETIQSGAITATASDNIGYTVSEFNQPLTEINVRQTVLSNCVTIFPPTVPYPNTVCDTARFTRPWLWNPYHENNVGVPSRVAVYNKNNQLLSEKTTVYDELQVGNPSFALANRAFRLNGKNYSFESSFYEFYHKFRVKSDTSKAFSQDGTNPVVSVTNNTYKDEMPYNYKIDYPGKHNQVVMTETTNSNGFNVISWNKYAADFVFGRDSTYDCISYDSQLGVCLVYGYIYTPHEPINPEAKGIYQLQQKNILHGVVESISLQNGYYTGSAYQTYYPKDSVTFSAGLPKSNFVLENMPRNSFIQAKYSRTTTGETWVKDAEYDLKTTTEVYNPIGLPIKVSARFGTSSKTDYDVLTNTLPIKTYKNLGSYDEQTMQTEYAVKIFGVSKETGTNNLEMRKEYYPDGKLKQVKDKDGNVLKHVEYLYRGETSTITSGASLATDPQKNRIIIRVPRIATTNATALDYTDCMISIQYMDGFGRAMQTVGYRASPKGKDLISGTSVYDVFGRAYKSYLPVESPYQDGRYVVPSIVENIAIAFYADSVAYSEVIYENSPMSRPIRSFGVGKAWRTNNKFTESSYETAGVGIVRFVAYHDVNGSYALTYSDNQLAKKTLVDERGSTVIEYTNKSGNVVQRTVQADSQTPPSGAGGLTTAYIYDELERLRYILPPKAYDVLSIVPVFTETGSTFNELVYAYHYDGRNRVYESHSPGIGWSRVVYNRLNQAVMSQDDDELAKNNTWNYVQTDGQGRSIRTGQVQLPSNFTRQYLQNLFDNFTDNQQFEERSNAFGNIQQYTNRSFPVALRTYITDVSLKTVAFYDDYLWRTNNQYSGQITDYDFQVNPFNTTAYSVANAKGLGTGGFIKDEIYGDFLFPSVVYYDEKNRNLQSIGYTHLQARNQSDTKYNFVGEMLQSRVIYRKLGATDHVRTTEQTLDHIGRRKDFYYTLTQGAVNKVPRLKMTSFIYDAIGRLKIKSIQPNSNISGTVQTGLGTNTSTWQTGVLPNITTPIVINQQHTVTIPTNQTILAGSLYDKGTLTLSPNSKLQLGTLPANRSGSALQNIDYNYHIRGALIGVNLNASGNLQTTDEKLFSYKLDYENDGRYFDGSIAKQTWKNYGQTQNRSYSYTYDKSNRLTNAVYMGVGNENYNVSQDYDANGNIQHLQRYSKTGTNTYGLVDNLTYSLLNTGNKLQKVDDAITGNIFAKDFRDVSGNDYTYSVDGKMIADANKGITSIEYNFLDLVSKITFSDGRTVENWYTSTGGKRQRRVTKNGIIQTIIYDGEMIYTYVGTSPILQNFSVLEIQNEEGRLVNNKLEYGYTDHLGNLRVSYRDSLGVAIITQSQSYDPWSNQLAGLEYQLSGNQSDNFLVCGKESDSESGNILLDWRDYDSVTGRMNSYDPEDQSMSMSGYAYCGNNPVMRVDPDGRFAFVPFLVGALVSGHIGGVISGIAGGSYEKGFVTGFLSGAAGYFAPIGFLPGMGYGAGTGAAIGGINAAMNGGNIWKGALTGAIIGGVTGGISGGIGALQKGGNFWTGYREPHDLLLSSDKGDIYGAGSFKKDELSYNDETIKAFKDKNFSDVSGVSKMTMNRMPNGYKNDGTYFINPKGQQVLAVTKSSIWKGGSSSNIYFAKGAFHSPETMFLIMGHELGHVQHAVAGFEASATGFTEEEVHIPIYRWTQSAGIANKWYGFVNNFQKAYSTQLQFMNPQPALDILKLPLKLLFRKP